MKTTYIKTVDVLVSFDDAFKYRINNCPIDQISDRVEEQMWDHWFKTADVMDFETGELLLTIEKD